MLLTIVAIYGFFVLVIKSYVIDQFLKIKNQNIIGIIRGL